MPGEAAAAAAEPARRYAPRARVDGAPSFLIKETGLALLSSLVTSLKMPTDADLAEGHPVVAAVNAVGNMLEQLKPQALFDDWAPPARAPETQIALKDKDATSDTRRTDTYAPEKALGSSGHWCSSANPGSGKSWWQVKLSGETDISAVRFSFQTKMEPEAVTIQSRIGTSGDWTTHMKLTAAEVAACPKFKADGAKAGDEPRRIDLPRGVRATQVRLQFDGFIKTNTEKYHSLKGFSMVHPNAEVVFNDTARVLGDVEDWLTKGTSANAPVLRAASLRALTSLGIASGSLRSVLRLASVLVDDSVGYGTAGSSSSPSFGVCKDFLGKLDGQFDPVCTTLAGGGGGGGGMAAAGDAAFDTFSSGTALHSDGNPLKVRCTSGNGHAVLNLGFSKGKCSWKARLIEDSRNGECTCFGLAIKPVADSNYERSPSLWMYRAYNGNLYARGRQIGSKQKYHPGEVLEFTLDMDKGTLSVVTNGADQGVIFSDLAGNTVYPAIAFYSSSRTSEFFDVVVEGGGGASKYLAGTSQAKNQGSIRGFGADLGTDSKKIIVEGTKYTNSLSMLPAANGSAVATFDLYDKDKDETPTGENAYDTFAVKVALNDDIGEAAVEGPVKFEILDGADKVLWTSPDITTAKDVHSTQLQIAGVEQLKLRVSCAGPNANAHAVWLDPVVRRAPWIWERKKAASDAGEPASFRDISASLLATTGFYARQALRSMRTAPPVRPGAPAMMVESPYAVQADGPTFAASLQLLENVTRASGSNTEMVLSVLAIIKANLRRLVVSGMDPEEAGVSSGSGGGDEEGKEGAAERESKDGADGDGSTLAPLHKLLSKLAGQPGKPVPDGVAPEVSQEASDCLDTGLELFYPTPAARMALLEGLVSTGGIVEAHFRWPSKGSDGEDDFRYERAILLLQSQCRKRGWRCDIIAEYGVSVHTICELPTDAPSADFLQSGFAGIMSAAGFGQWTFPLGCTDPEIKLKIERHLAFNRRERMSSEPGKGWVRLYPRGVGSFDEVRAQVALFHAAAIKDGLSIEAAVPKRAEAATKDDDEGKEEDGAAAAAAAGGGNSGGGNAADFSDRDIELVVAQTSVSREAAIEALRHCNGDIVNAIMELTM